MSTTATRLDSPVLYEWEIDEDSPRYEYPRGQPPGDVLQIMFSVLAFINALVACSSLVLILGILRSKRLRKNGFNLYVLFMTIPDFLGSFFCLITCSLSAPISRYYSEAMCGFQAFYLVFAFAGNAWVNAAIVHEINKLLTFSKNRRRYFPLTRQQIFCRVALIYTYALIWGILAAFPIPGMPFHTKVYIGFACFPMEQDPASTWFFYFVFLPGILMIPFAYTVYVMGRIMLLKMIPKSGRTRSVSLFLMRLVAVYFFGWMPFLILSFIGNFVMLNAWIAWAGAAASHFQGFISAVVVFKTSDDIRRQMLLVLRCNLSESDDEEITKRRQSSMRFSSRFQSRSLGFSQEIDRFSSRRFRSRSLGLSQESEHQHSKSTSRSEDLEQQAELESGNKLQTNFIKTDVDSSDSKSSTPGMDEPNGTAVPDDTAPASSTQLKS